MSDERLNCHTCEFYSRESEIMQAHCAHGCVVGIDTYTGSDRYVEPPEECPKRKFEFVPCRSCSGAGHKRIKRAKPIPMRPVWDRDWLGR